MTQEDKKLLLKDLCARLPYNVRVEYNGTTLTNIFDVLSIAHGRIVLCLPFMSKTQCPLIEEVKPYLFPISSMTEEQKEELSNEMCYLTHSQIEGRNPNGLIESTVFEIDFYNKHHIDYRGLIEKGLALDATGLNIYN